MADFIKHPVVELPDRKPEPVFGPDELVFSEDEFIRAGTTAEVLSKLRPAFRREGGSVTAGNSSGLNDGACALLLASEAGISKWGLRPLARFVASAVVGVEPRIMGIGPVEAIPKALKLAGLKQEDLHLVELNEAFASQSIAVIRETGLNPDIVNVNGGAISIGHPLGCTGAKLTVQILNELKRRDQKYGLVTMCVGTGQGAAGVIEML